MEDKRKHLEMIQAIITRMGGNLFLLKGWSVTLIVALFAVTKQNMNDVSILFSFCILFIFWLLDGYFLSVERCYRGLYNDVRLKPDNQIDYTMDFRPYNTGRNTWFRSMFSKTLVIFYGALLLVMVAATFSTKIKSVDLNVVWNDKNALQAEVCITELCAAKK